MSTQLSEKKVKRHVIIIAIFYIISGFWEGSLASVQGQYATGFNPLLYIYKEYLWWLGCISILVGFSLLFKINLGRLIAIALAWWNLFTAPLLDVWFSIYSISIKKFTTVTSWFSLWGDLLILFVIMTLIRIYIIRTLSIKRAGYIFLKKK